MKVDRSSRKPDDSLGSHQILIGLFLLSTDNTKMEPPRMGRRNFRHIPKQGVHCFCEAEVADVLVVEHFARVYGSNLVGKFFTTRPRACNRCPLLKRKRILRLPAILL